MKMEKDPNTWAALLAWLSAHQPAIAAGVFAGVMALCRVVYGGGGIRKAVLEGAICGLIGMSLIPLLEYFSLSSGLANFAGCMVGFIGVDKLRDYADRFLGRKADAAS